MNKEKKETSIQANQIIEDESTINYVYGGPPASAQHCFPSGAAIPSSIDFNPV
jgi:hypothetical protein